MKHDIFIGLAALAILASIGLYGCSYVIDSGKAVEPGEGVQAYAKTVSLPEYSGKGIVVEGSLISENGRYYLMEELTKEKLELLTVKGDLYNSNGNLLYENNNIVPFALDDFNLNSWFTHLRESCAICSGDVPAELPAHVIVSGILYIDGNQKIFFISEQYGYSFISESDDVFNPVVAIGIAEQAAKKDVIERSKSLTAEDQINLDFDQAVYENKYWNARLGAYEAIQAWRIQFNYNGYYKQVYVSAIDGSVISVKDDFPANADI